MKWLDVEADDVSYAFCLDGIDKCSSATGWFQNGFSRK
jgi:hypothetical protein